MGGEEAPGPNPAEAEADLDRALRDARSALVEATESADPGEAEERIRIFFGAAFALITLALGLTMAGQVAENYFPGLFPGGPEVAQTVNSGEPLSAMEALKQAIQFAEAEARGQQRMRILSFLNSLSVLMTIYFLFFYGKKRK